MERWRKTETRPGRIAYEIAGLRWLADAGPGSARVVEVLDSGPGWLEEPRLASAAPTPAAAEEFGRALALTHAAGAPHLGAPPQGWEGDAWMGRSRLTLLATEETRSWGAFSAEHRILPYIGAAPFTASQRRRIEALCDHLASGALDHPQPALVEASGRAARIHGDLWAGNLMWTPEGATLIDPAAQGGHAEEDLAALGLFGCPLLDRILAAYDEVSPLADGWRERVDLHRLHMLAVHAFLFGGGYLGDVMSIVDRYV